MLKDKRAGQKTLVDTDVALKGSVNHTTHAVRAFRGTHHAQSCFKVRRLQCTPTVHLAPSVELTITVSLLTTSPCRRTVTAVFTSLLNITWTKKKSCRL